MATAPGPRLTPGPVRRLYGMVHAGGPNQMSAAEVLKETEKAAGDDAMYDEHCKLVTLRNGEGKLKADAQRERANLETLTRRKTHLEPQVARFREREENIRKVSRPRPRRDDPRAPSHARREPTAHHACTWAAICALASAVTEPSRTPC